MHGLHLSTVENADKILVLENGELCQQGTHHELLKDINNIYYRFVKIRKEVEGWQL